MLRSQINHLLMDAAGYFEHQAVRLPPFAFWSPDDWAVKSSEVEEIVVCRLGWDVTDFGLGDFYRYGLLLFTIRNGNPNAGYRKSYAEKLMIAEAGQEHQMHYHARKMEDIINRAGGKLAIRVFNADAENGLENSPVNLSVDGVSRQVQAGEVLLLEPGESITLPPRCFHKFWAEEKRVLLGEVSMVNDDETDNIFYQPFGTGRFPQIEEDELPLYPLCTEYNRFWGGNGRTR